MQTLRYRGLLLLVILLHLQNPCKPQAFGFELTNGAEKVEMDIELYNNLIVVPVTLNHFIPLKFILDTGVKTAILTDKGYSDLLNIDYDRKTSIWAPGYNKEIFTYIARNISISLPGVEGKGRSMLVLEEDYLELRNLLGADVHGILGYELFSRFVISIDYENLKLTLYERKAFKPRKVFTPIPIHFRDTKPFIYASFTYEDQNYDGEFLIDTGASHAVLIEQDEEKGISKPDKNISASLGKGLGGPIDGVVGRINQFQLDKYEFNNVITSFPNQYAYLDSIFGQRDGTIGGEFLYRFKVIFDYASSKIYIRKNRHFKDKFEFSMSGLSIETEGVFLEKFKVYNVLKNSVGEEMDIRTGDEVISINGRTSKELGLIKINDLLRSKNGKKIRMRIRRDDEVIRKVFRLRRMI